MSLTPLLSYLQHALGVVYETGKFGEAADLAKAIDYYRLAAAQGHAASLTCLGVLHFTGRGVPRDIPQAVDYYSKATEAGSIVACFNLGLCYEEGGGVPRDLEAARRHFSRAAEAGHTGARAGIGEWRPPRREGRGSRRGSEKCRSAAPAHAHLPRFSSRLQTILLTYQRSVITS